MEKKFSKEDIIKNGDSDELYELRMWLFKESCRLENQESTLDDRFARLEADEKKFREEASAMKKEIALQEGKLRKDAAFFDQKLAILRKGYDDLNEDRHKLEEEKKRIEKEKEYMNEAVYDGKELLFRGVHNQLSLKKRYKDLLKIFHPDNLCGDREVVQIINAEPNQNVQVEKIPLQNGKPLCRVTFNSVEKAMEWLTENQNALVELTLESDSYLKAEERKRLYQSHQGIIHLNRKTLTEPNSTTENNQINLNQNLPDLFKDYFKTKNNGQEPNDDIMNLLNEIIH